jgi:hypothetical protein
MQLRSRDLVQLVRTKAELSHVSCAEDEKSFVRTRGNYGID